MKVCISHIKGRLFVDSYKKLISRSIHWQICRDSAAYIL